MSRGAGYADCATIVHDYENIDFIMRWDVITRDLPGLSDQLEALDEE
jgi:uncharacterized protein with HEPN domain